MRAPDIIVRQLEPPRAPGATEESLSLSRVGLVEVGTGIGAVLADYVAAVCVGGTAHLIRVFGRAEGVPGTAGVVVRPCGPAALLGVMAGAVPAD